MPLFYIPCRSEPESNRIKVPHNVGQRNGSSQSLSPLDEGQTEIFLRHLVSCETRKLRTGTTPVLGVVCVCTFVSFPRKQASKQKQEKNNGATAPSQRYHNNTRATYRKHTQATKLNTAQKEEEEDNEGGR